MNSEYRRDLEGLFLAQKSHGSASDVMTRLRHLYKTTKLVKMEELAGNDRYNIRCVVDGELVGYAIKDVFILKFFDVSGAELMVVPSDIFENNLQRRTRSATTGGPVTTKPKSKTETIETRKESVSSGEKKKFSFSFSKKGRSPSVAENPVVAKPAVVTEGRLKASMPAAARGPFPMSELRLWWKFHLVNFFKIFFFFVLIFFSFFFQSSLLVFFFLPERTVMNGCPLGTRPFLKRANEFKWSIQREFRHFKV